MVKRNRKRSSKVGPAFSSSASILQVKPQVLPSNSQTQSNTVNFGQTWSNITKAAVHGVSCIFIQLKVEAANASLLQSRLHKVNQGKRLAGSA
jgi:hypothetical protein